MCGGKCLCFFVVKIMLLFFWFLLFLKQKYWLKFSFNDVIYFIKNIYLHLWVCPCETRGQFQDISPFDFSEKLTRNTVFCLARLASMRVPGIVVSLAPPYMIYCCLYLSWNSVPCTCGASTCPTELSTWLGTSQFIWFLQEIRCYIWLLTL